MAGDWIKMRLDLQTHPKVVRILSATKSDKFRAIGGLHAVWSVFDTHSADGRLDGYTPETLDHIIGWPGFAEAMIAVDWLAFDGAQTLLLPEFDEHNGKSGKRRAEDQKRKRDDRKGPQSVRKTSADETDKNRTREEKRREDINTPLTPRKRGGSAFDSKGVPLPDWISRELWVEWCVDRSQRRKPITQAGAKRQLAQLADFRKQGFTPEEVIAHCIAGGFQGLYAPKRTPGNVQSLTVPGPQGPDPVLEKLKRDGELAVSPPAAVRELAQRLRAH